MSRTLKEIALELLERWRALVPISDDECCRYHDEKARDEEGEKYRREIEEAAASAPEGDAYGFNASLLPGLEESQREGWDPPVAYEVRETRVDATRYLIFDKEGNDLTGRFKGRTIQVRVSRKQATECDRHDFNRIASEFKQRHKITIQFIADMTR